MAERVTGMGRGRSGTDAVTLARRLHADLQAMVAAHGARVCVEALREALPADEDRGWDWLVSEALLEALEDMLALQAGEARVVAREASGRRVAFGIPADGQPVRRDLCLAIFAGVVRAIDPKAPDDHLARVCVHESYMAGANIAHRVR